MTRIEAARAAWSQIIDTLRTEPLVDARKLAVVIGKELDELFPRPSRRSRRTAGLIDLTGERYGSLVGVRYVRRGDTYGRSVWLFQCDCGRAKEIRADYVRNGDTRSCGCLRTRCLAERAANRGHR